MMGNVSSSGGARTTDPPPLFFLLWLLHRYWGGTDGRPPRDHQQERRRAKTWERAAPSRRPARAPVSDCGCSCCEDVISVCSDIIVMAPNTGENGTKLPNSTDSDWNFEECSKEQQRPPVYNPEDYAAALRRWGRRGGAEDKPPPPTSEMSLKQFASVAELLAKLRADLRLSYPSFVQEFIGDPLDGVTLLLELLRGVQLSQASQAPGPPSAMRRALLDELACLLCLRACTRHPDAARRLARSPAGLFTLAVGIMSNLTKSRVLALQLLTFACGCEGGHGAVSEALSTLRLRFGEPVRFRFLSGMLSSATCPPLAAAALAFLNALAASAPSPQHRLYLQAELAQAGFTPHAIYKMLPASGAAAQQVRAELAKWERGVVDVESLTARAEAAERDARILREKLALLERRVQILQEEKGVLVSLEQCLKERCCELEEEVTTLRSGDQQGSIKKDGSAEDEGISSSDHEQSLGEDDVEREPLAYELYQAQNDTIMVEGEAALRETCVDVVDDDAKITLDDEEEETTIDEVIEELRNIINDAESEAYAAEEAAKKKQKETTVKKEEDKKILVSKKPDQKVDKNKHPRNTDHKRQNKTMSNNKTKETSVDIQATESEDEIRPTRILPQPPRRSRSLVHLMFNSRLNYNDDCTTATNPFFDDETPSNTSDEGSDSLLSSSKDQVPVHKKSVDSTHMPSKSMSTLYITHADSNYGKSFRYQPSKTNITIGENSVFKREVKQNKSAQKALIKRSESFHHVYNQDHILPVGQRLRHESEKTLNETGTEEDRPMTRCGSFDGLFFVTDIANSPNISPKSKHHFSSEIESFYPGLDSQTNLNLCNKKIKSKSLDRIDEGLDAFVDIVVAPDNSRSRHSSGRGSTEDWSLEWDKNYIASRSRQSVNAVNPEQTPPPITIVSRSTSKPQIGHRDYQNIKFFRHSDEENSAYRYPPDGSSQPLLSNVNSSKISYESSKKSSPTNSYCSNKPFIISRGHTNAGLYSGQHIMRDSPSHIIMNTMIVSSSPEYSRPLSQSNTRAGIVTNIKVTDLPSGLY